MNDLIAHLVNLDLITTTIMSSSVVGVSVKLHAYLKTKAKEEKKYQEKMASSIDALQQQMIVLMRSSIINQCKEHLKQDCISTEDFDNLMSIYETYRLAGGNGTAETYVNKVKALKLNNQKRR